MYKTAQILESAHLGVGLKGGGVSEGQNKMALNGHLYWRPAHLGWGLKQEGLGSWLQKVGSEGLNRMGLISTCIKGPAHLGVGAQTGRVGLQTRVGGLSGAQQYHGSPLAPVLSTSSYGRGLDFSGYGPVELYDYLIVLLLFKTTNPCLEHCDSLFALDRW